MFHCNQLNIVSLVEEMGHTLHLEGLTGQLSPLISSVLVFISSLEMMFLLPMYTASMLASLQWVESVDLYPFQTNT